MIDVYNWAGSLRKSTKYLELRNLPNYVVSKTETVEHCKDVLHMYGIDAPVQLLEDKSSQKEKNNVFDIVFVFDVGHHGWVVKRILGFRWSKKAEITLEIMSFW